MLREDQKNEIRKKLSKLKTIKENEGREAPSFFQIRKEIIMQKCTEMGMDLFEVKDFLEDKGIWEDNVELIIDNAKNRGFINSLRVSKQQNA